MSAPRVLEFVDAAELDRRRPDVPSAAWSLDRLALDEARHVGSLLLGVAGGAVAMLGHSSMLVGVVFALSAPMLSRPWQLDEEGQGGRLRRVLPLRRRSVVTARYLGAVLLATCFAIACVATMAVVQLVTGRDPGDAWFTLWVLGMALTTAMVVGIPVRVRFGLGATYIAVLVCGLAVMVPCVLLAKDVLGGERFPTVASALIAVAVFALAVVAGGLLSHRLAVRLYERKDL